MQNKNDAEFFDSMQCLKITFEGLCEAIEFSDLPLHPKVSIRAIASRTRYLNMIQIAIENIEIVHREGS